MIGSGWNSYSRPIAYCHWHVRVTSFGRRYRGAAVCGGLSADRYNVWTHYEDDGPRLVALLETVSALRLVFSCHYGHLCTKIALRYHACNAHRFRERTWQMVGTTFEVRVANALLQLRLNEWLVVALFADGHISSGKAATLLSISRVAFLGLLRARGIAYINDTADELAEEFAAVAVLGSNPNS